MEPLNGIDEDLLKKSVSKVNIDTGMFKSVPTKGEVVTKEKVTPTFFVSFENDPCKVFYEEVFFDKSYNSSIVSCLRNNMWAFP
jgi:hypothetical protein